MSRSHTGHFIKTNTTLNGDPGREMGGELSGVDAIGQDFDAREPAGRDAANRDAASRDAAQMTGAPVGRSLNGAPLASALGGKVKGLGRAVGLGRPLGAADETQQSNQGGGHKALSVLRQALPVVKNLLPLLEGNLLAVVSNLLTTRPQPPAKVDLAPIETQLTEIQLLQHDVRSKVAEHHTTLKRVEDQLEMVKEATDRNTMEQQELMEDLRAMGSKVNLFAAMLIGLLVLSVLLNFLLFMHIKQVLP
jgi:hypothetical protein